jgi:hypothetical protein
MNETLVNLISSKFQKIKIELSRSFLNKIEQNMINTKEMK